MKILGSYNGITEEEIRAMPHEDLVEAVLRIFNMEGSTIDTSVYLDEIADAFRGRQ
jgi:hypothetical protein